MKIKGIIGFIIAGFVIVFVVQNATSVDVRLLFWKPSLSLSILIFLMVSLGFTAGWFLHYFAVRAQEKKIALKVIAKKKEMEKPAPHKTKKK